MRVFCPNCSEPIQIAQDLAGKTTHCPLCHAAFTAPPLFGSSPSSVGNPPAAPPVVPPPPPPPPSPPSPPSPTVTTAPEPTSPLPTPIPPVPDLPPIPPAAPPPPIPPAAPPPPIPPAATLAVTPQAAPTLADPPSSYGRRIGLSISPELIQWMAPACLAAAVVLTLFFSWNGAYPGGHGVYTQGAVKSLFGWISIDRVGEKVLRMNPAEPAEGQRRLEDEVRSNYLMLLYLPMLLGTVVLAVVFTMLPQLPIRVPPHLQSLLPWRPLIIAALAVLLTILLAVQAGRGFGLENALRNIALAEAVKDMPRDIPINPEQRSAEDEKRAEIVEGQHFGRYNIRQTTALELVFALQILAAIGAVGAFIISRRTDRPMPRVEFHW